MWQYITFALLGMAAMAAAQLEPLDAYNRSNYPNPQVDVYKCGRFGKVSYLCDPNHLLTAEEANQLQLQLERVANETKCPCSRYICQNQHDRKGYRIGVALMRKMATNNNNNNNNQQNGEERDEQALIRERLGDAELFAYHLEQNWGLGQCEEDVVILYSHEDAVIYTMTGDAARIKLRSSMIGEITLGARGLFGTNTYKGLRKMISEYRDVFENNYMIKARSAPQVGALQAAPGSATSAVRVTLGILLSCLVAAILN